MIDTLGYLVYLMAFGDPSAAVLWAVTYFVCFKIAFWDL